MRTPICTTAALLLLVACGAERNDTATEEAPQAAPDLATATDHAGADEGGMNHGGDAKGGTAMAEGRVIELPGANRVRIDHGPIDAIGMAAMTMTFEAKRGVDLAGIEAGDEVHFLLDRGRDGTLRLEAICDVSATDHAACMADMTAKR